MRTIALALLLILSTASWAVSATYIVRPDGTGHFPTIWAAINGVTDGDIIELTDGTFTGAGNNNLLYLGKAITIRSQSGNPEACVLDCEAANSRGFYFQHGETTDSVLEGVTITNGYAEWNAGGMLFYNSSPLIINCIIRNNSTRDFAGAGIACGASSVHFVNCIISDNDSGNLAGGLYCYASDPTFTDCTFVGNSASADGGAVYCEGNSTPSFVNCTFYGNTSGGLGGGFGIIDGSSVNLENTIIGFSTGGEAVYCDGTGSATLSCCDLFGNAGGDWTGCIADQLGINGNISRDPCFCDAHSRDFALAANSPCAPFTYPNQECDLIGAWPVGCPQVSVEETTSVLAIPVAVDPNPSSGPCRISFGLPAEGIVTIDVTDVSGRTVRRLVRSTYPAGTHSAVWDGRDDAGRKSPSGTYTVGIRTGHGVTTARAVLIR